MTVKELIEQLSKITNKDAEILIYDNCGGSYLMKQIDVYFTEGMTSIRTTLDDLKAEFVEFS
jgi:hypothetical protein|nr:MAG TPA: INTERLEUKIN-13-handed four-helix bundle, CYTOKINE [Caudoviricetes sp.]DAS91453.1 MAG TPA: INTERLEUKIN-13-handed four-helix bundle, CYTOKINE [Caudoviricetes sp.]